MYENCEVFPDKLTILVHDTVTLSVLKHENINKNEIKCKGNLLKVEWVADPVSDMIADSLLSLILQMESNPAILQTQPKVSFEEEEQQNFDLIAELIHSRYDKVELDTTEKIIKVEIDGKTITINHETKDVECEDAELKKQVQNFLRKIDRALYPLD